jgi:hypothetical protein
VQKRRELVAGGCVRGALILDKPSLLLFPVEGPDAPNVVVNAREGGRFEQLAQALPPPAPNQEFRAMRKAAAPAEAVRSRAFVPPQDGLFGGDAACPSPGINHWEDQSVTASCDREPDLRFAGPALVLADVPVPEDGCLHVPAAQLPAGWSARALRRFPSSSSRALTHFTSHAASCCSSCHYSCCCSGSLVDSRAWLSAAPPQQLQVANQVVPIAGGEQCVCCRCCAGEGDSVLYGRHVGNSSGPCARGAGALSRSMLTLTGCCAAALL